MRKQLPITLLLLLAVLSVHGQKQKKTKASFNAGKKGRMYIQWGWNRGFYTRSTLSMKGNDYNIKLNKLKAHDKFTTPVNYHNYLQPNRLTIPQTDFRFGYFIKDNLAVSLGFDHMKYVMDQNQWVNVDGVIERQSSPYKGVYKHAQVKMTPDFLQFEHTNGLNYINIEAEKYFPVYRSASSRVIFQWYGGGGAGVLFPRTDTDFLDYENNDRFHVSGYGVSAKAGVHAVFLKALVWNIEAKGGYINMPDIVLHKKGIQGKGKQHFLFAELSMTIGATFSLRGRSKRRKLSETNYN
jgi:hypothetical protein